MEMSLNRCQHILSISLLCSSIAVSECKSCYFSELQEMFSFFDKDKNGTMPSYELGTLLRAMGHNPSDTEVDNMRKEVDQDGEITLISFFMIDKW